MKLFLLVLGLLLGASLATPIWAQASIRGKVTNKTNKSTISEGRLLLIPRQTRRAKRLEVQPSAQGTYIFTNVPEGVYDLEYHGAGYVSQQIAGLYVRAHTEKVAFFHLTPSTQANTPMEIIHTYASLQALKDKEVRTASFELEKLLEAPASVHLITRDDIRQQGLQTLTEVLELIPSIEVQERSHYYFINTVSIRGVEGNRKFVILLDGVRISAFATMNTMLEHNFFIGNAEQIEILLGPASVLYGADAVSGVINIISGKTDQTGFSIGQSTGRFSTQAYQMQATYRGKKIAALLNAYAYRSDNPNLPRYYPTEYDWFIRRYSQTGEMPALPDDTSQLIVLPIQPFNIQTDAQWVQGKLIGKTWEAGAMFNRARTSGSTGLNPMYGPITRSDYYAEANMNAYVKHFYTHPNGRFQLQSLLNFQQHTALPNNQARSIFNNYQTVYMYGFDRTVQLQAVAGFRPDSNQQWQAGLALAGTQALPIKTTPFDAPWRMGNLREQLANQHYAGSAVTWVDGRDTALRREIRLVYQGDIGAFAQYKARVFKRLFVNAGARVDWFAQPNRSALIPTLRAGLLYKPNPHLTARAFFGQAYLAPALDQRYADYAFILPTIDSATKRAIGYTIPYATMQNPDLRPERMNTWEASASYSKGEWFAGINAYYNDLAQVVGYVSTQNQTIQGIAVESAERYENGGRLRSYGFTSQVEFAHAFAGENAPSIKLSGDYAFSAGNFTTSSGADLLLPYSAKHTLRAAFTGSYRGASLNLRMLYRSPSKNGGRLSADGELVQVENPAYAILNLMAVYRLQLPRARWNADLFVQVRNLTDRRYYQPSGTPVDLLPLSPQDPIRWNLGIRFAILK